jgi:hypothetical protein
MTKVHITKHCRVDGKHARPGDVVETSPHRAKALTDNGYAKVPDKKAAAPAEQGSAPEKTPDSASSDETT